MLKQAARAGRAAFAGLLTIGASTLAAPAAPARPGSAIGPKIGRTTTLTAVTGGAGVLWSAALGVGLGRSIDAGASWVKSPLDSSYSRVTTDPVDPLTVYASGSAGVAKTTDGGATWKVIDSTPDAVLGIAPGAPDTLYLASPGDTANLATVARSDDGGATWRPLATLPPHSEALYEIDVDPEDPENVYLQGWGFDDAGAGPIALKSADGGRSWSYLLGVPGKAILRSLSWDLRAPGTLLGVVHDGPVRSRDNGATWEIVGAGLPAGAFAIDLAFDRASGITYLSLGTTKDLVKIVGEIWTSADDGTTWTERFEHPGILTPLVLDGVLPGQVYAVAQDGPLVSSDAGLHWRALGGSVPPWTSRTCVPSDTVLCLAGGRFALQLRWTLPDGTGGDAHASPLTDGSGGFWFFSPESLERVVKVVDGRAVNGHFWLYAGALSDVASTLTVTDLTTGATRTYRNRRGRLTSFADTGAFAAAGAASRAVEGSTAPVAPANVAAPAAGTSCASAADTLCLMDSRFAVRVTWRLPGAAATSATAVPLYQNTGAFWFFGVGNPELSVKVLDGRAINGHFWVFLAGLSTVDYTATVTDTASGASKSYRHPAGAPASSADTAF